VSPGNQATPAAVLAFFSRAQPIFFPAILCEITVHQIAQGVLDNIGLVAPVSI